MILKKGHAKVEKESVKIPIHEPTIANVIPAADLWAVFGMSLRQMVQRSCAADGIGRWPVRRPPAASWGSSGKLKQDKLVNMPKLAASKSVTVLPIRRIRYIDGPPDISAAVPENAVTGPVSVFKIDAYIGSGACWEVLRLGHIYADGLWDIPIMAGYGTMMWYAAPGSEILTDKIENIIVRCDVPGKYLTLAQDLNTGCITCYERHMVTAGGINNEMTGYQLGGEREYIAGIGISSIKAPKLESAASPRRRRIQYIGAANAG